jgi:glycosyltransferase involved in cell wall biosynthesis
MATYSFVVPIHNEEEMLAQLHCELSALADRLDGPAEFVLVDDGSTDDSWSMMCEFAANDPRCRVLRLSRNFGHQVAVTAGLDRASGDAVVIMDADLQDPPEVVLEMARRWREGYDVVYGQRTDRDSDTRFKRVSAGWFYNVLNRLSSVDIPQQVGDFRLIDRAVVDAINHMPERNRYVRGMFAWLGFRQIGVEYTRPARAAGTTSYSLSKMLRLASDGVIGYSKAPLRLSLIVGVVTATTGAAGAVVSSTLAVANPAGSRPSLTFWSGMVLNGFQLIAVGLMGEYIARIYDESLDRPLYVVSETRGGHARPVDQQFEAFEVPMAATPLFNGHANRALVNPAS